jgi:hypothetical protein
MSQRNDVPPMSGAERARALRRRRREKLRVLTIEIRDDEVGLMVKYGLLRVEDRDHPFAVLAALYLLLDRAFPALAAGRLPPG